MRLLDTVTIGQRTAVNRVMFGPHVTNLGNDRRALTNRWIQYHASRARGGCGTIVTEGASVHDSDWPYERAPLAVRCGEGWSTLAAIGHDEGSLVIAGLDHAGGQGSSAYNQRELWAPSRVPEVNSREVPKSMEPDDIAAVVAGFGAAAALAVEADCDGVEINAGQHSLIRQFLSGLTNQRGDAWGHDRLQLAREVIAAVRARVGSEHVVGLRLSCDELAPWAGLTPDMSPGIAAELVGLGLDYIVVVRGSIFSVEKTRPDFHEPMGFNVDLCRNVRSTVRSARHEAVVFLQGSVAEWGQAESAISDGVCDGVEMTRAQIADPDLVAKLAAGVADTIRPCIRCNQTCQVRDARNPIVTCVGEPSSGRETEDPNWTAPATRRRNVLVIGGGPAGMEAARVAAARGHRVRLVERSPRLGGIAAITGPGGPLVEWLAREISRLGVLVETGVTVETGDLVDQADHVVIQATGSRAGVRTYAVAEGAVVFDVVDIYRDPNLLPAAGDVVVFDPIGGPIAIALAERLGSRAILITQDNIAGNELSRSGDLAPANTRLARGGVRIERRSLLREAAAGSAVIEDRFTAEQRTIDCVAVVDCGFRLPTEPMQEADVQIGDCVAPRSIMEAILEGRRAALIVDDH